MTEETKAWVCDEEELNQLNAIKHMTPKEYVQWIQDTLHIQLTSTQKHILIQYLQHPHSNIILPRGNGHTALHLRLLLYWILHEEETDNGEKDP